MTKSLLIPVRVDALYSQHGQMVVGPLFDFDQMPWNNGERQINPQLLPLSEAIANTPLNPPNQFLPQGIHLHWSLPKAFSQGEHALAGSKRYTLNFPAVPTRWLVIRSSEDKKWPKKSWIVQSDFLSEKASGQSKSVVVPFPEENNSPPFRYLGRQQEGSIFAEDIAADSLKKRNLILTVTGYEPSEVELNHPMTFGYEIQKKITTPKEATVPKEIKNEITATYRTPTFAAFYPHCSGVLGFHDDLGGELPSQEELSKSKLSYTIIGWYDTSSTKKILTLFRKELQALLEAEQKLIEQKRQPLLKDEQIDLAQQGLKAMQAQLTSEQSVEEPAQFKQVEAWWKDLRIRIEKALEHSLQLQMPPGQPFLLPSEILCCARFSLQSGAPQKGTDVDQGIEIGLGDTGTQALIAYLSSELGGDKKNVLEQLQAVHLNPRLPLSKIDTGLKFKEAWHDEGFNSRSGGRIWGTRFQFPNTARADATLPKPENTLPEEANALLLELNKEQKALDKLADDIESLRQYVFADWYKYQVCTHPADDERENYPDSDKVKYFIENGTLSELKNKIQEKKNKSDMRNHYLHQLTDVIKRANLNNQKISLTVPLNAVQVSLKKLPTDKPSFSKANEKIQEMLDKIEEYTNRKEGSTDTEQDSTGRTDHLSLLDKKCIAFQQDLTQQFKELNRLIREGFDVKDLPPQGDLCSKDLPALEKAIQTLTSCPRCEVYNYAAPRYMQARDPVMLITGELATPSERYGQKSLSCSIWEGKWQNGEGYNANLQKQIDTLCSSFSDTSPMLQGTPWHPLFLEWEVEFLPLESMQGAQTDHPKYSAQSIEASYKLVEPAEDLTLIDSTPSVVQRANIYSNRCILTPHANVRLQNDLQAYISQYLIPPYNEAEEHKAEKDQLSSDWSKDNEVREKLEKLKNWYQKKDLASTENGPHSTLTILDAYLKLLSLPILSQALGGFNDALLMHHLTFQFSPRDPANFEDHQAFTQQVADTIGSMTKMAPSPFNNFNPLRGGALKILRLRLVDIFGRPHDIQSDQKNIRSVFASLPLKGDKNVFLLPPRITQPARINFRWLSANSSGADRQEMTGLSDTTPICGWVLPNHLDNSLVFYDAEGTLLGWLDDRAKWHAAPGTEKEGCPPKGLEDSIANAYLQQVAQSIQYKGADHLQKFITTIDSALDSIQPENLTHDEGLVLLIARPIAVVRASLDLQIKGLPCIDHSWESFRLDLTRTTRETAGYTQVKFPIRIGEFKQLNDGLVGYWIENEQEKISRETSIFYACQETVASTSVNANNVVNIQPHTEDPFHLYQSIDAKPQTLTLLIDPRGKLHATTGILPTKALEIPAEYYVESLKKMQVFFRTGAVFAAHKKIALSLPDEPGYKWSWVEQIPGGWQETVLMPASDSPRWHESWWIRDGWTKLAVDTKDIKDTKQPDAKVV